MIRLDMTNYNMILEEQKNRRDEKQQAAKISALSSGRIHKYEYLTG